MERVSTGLIVTSRIVCSKDICSSVLREGNGSPLQYSCLENPMDGGAWWAAVHGVAKSQTRLSDFPFTLHFHALEKEMATHSSVPAWRIPGTGEPGGLPPMGSQSRTRLKRRSSSSSSMSSCTVHLKILYGIVLGRNDFAGDSHLFRWGETESKGGNCWKTSSFHSLSSQKTKKLCPLVRWLGTRVSRA